VSGRAGFVQKRRDVDTGGILVVAGPEGDPPVIWRDVGRMGTVAALRYAYRTSGKQLQAAGSAATGAAGEYSMSVPPGRYMLMAVSTTAMRQEVSAQTAKH